MAAAQIDAKLLEEIEKYIKENKVMIFSKSRCPYCKTVKELFKSLGVDFYALELDVTGIEASVATPPEKPGKSGKSKINLKYQGKVKGKLKKKSVADHPKTLLFVKNFEEIDLKEIRKKIKSETL